MFSPIFTATNAGLTFAGVLVGFLAIHFAVKFIDLESSGEGVFVEMVFHAVNFFALGLLLTLSSLQVLWAKGQKGNYIFTVSSDGPQTSPNSILSTTTTETWYSIFVAQRINFDSSNPCRHKLKTFRLKHYEVGVLTNLKELMESVCSVT